LQRTSLKEMSPHLSVFLSRVEVCLQLEWRLTFFVDCKSWIFKN
jgi:hypothetical protein